MRIEVTCREVEKYRRGVDVHSLYFDPASNAFSMSYCMGDMWGIDLECPLAIHPVRMTFEAGQVSVKLDRQADADAFASWLVEGEEKVQKGFETMRG